ncbi:GtrA family protein [Ferviditalea candida]|uniref:GtrA family protein n=1 Tax=Ferviditalea candida TaxID=3108399 RepID=A0ABU5ZGE6_9BACL|nr:GtrA family protein [Paenibacillaceae bacterium T2]
MKFLNKQFIKFIIVGLINTVSTYLLYLIFLKLTSYFWAYSISYILGIIISYFLNTLFVFREKTSLKKFLQFPIVYLVQYLINTFFLYLFVNVLSIRKEISPIIIIVITIPITFLLSKKIIQEKKRKTRN